MSTQESNSDQIKDLEESIFSINETINTSLEMCTRFSTSVQEQLSKVDDAIELRNRLTLILEDIYSKIENQSTISPERSRGLDESNADGAMLVHEVVKQE